MVVIVRDWYRWYLEGKDIPQDRNDCHLIYRKAIDNIGWRGDWEYTTAVAVGRGQGGHSCVGDSGNVWLHRRQITKPSVV